MSTIQTRLGGIQFGPPTIPPAVRNLMIATAAVFLLQRIAGISSGKTWIEEYGALDSALFWSGMVWQPFTRLFLHAEIGHLLGNLFILWMFGSTVASQWGPRRFLWLYLGGGTLGGVIQAVVEGALHWQGITLPLPLFVWGLPSVGASGAVYTLMTVYALANRDRVVSLIIVPLAMHAWRLIPVLIAFEVSRIFMFAGLGEMLTGSGVSSEAHLLGILVGWLAVRFLGSDGSRRLGREKPPRRPHLRVVGGDDGPVFH